VNVVGGGAVAEDRDGRKLLKIKIAAEVSRMEGEHIVDHTVCEYTVTFGRYGKLSTVLKFAIARADALGDRETTEP
jgi:hypothetical protein